MHEQNCGMDVHVLASKLTNKKHKLMITSQTSEDNCTSTTMKDQHTMTHEQN